MSEKIIDLIYSEPGAGGYIFHNNPNKPILAYVMESDGSNHPQHIGTIFPPSTYTSGFKPVGRFYPDDLPDKLKAKESVGISITRAVWFAVQQASFNK